MRVTLRGHASVFIENAVCMHEEDYEIASYYNRIAEHYESLAEQHQHMAGNSPSHSCALV